MNVEKTEKSLARIEANRRNAQLSTGPRTAAGKTAVCWNAMKHGLLAKEIVILAGDGKESTVEFRNLLASLQDQLAPEGAVEEMLVEKVAVCYWRLRRALRCEMGEIRKSLDTITFDKAFSRAESIRHVVDSWDSEPCEETLIHSSQGIKYLLGVLDAVQCELNEKGALSEDTSDKLTKAFGDEYGTLGCTLAFYFWVLKDGPSKSPDDFTVCGELPDHEECKRIIQEEIDAKKEFLRNGLDVMTENEELHAQSEMARLSLPEAVAAERIIRCETAIERQLYRALHELQRLQSTRDGQAGPIPMVIDVDVSTEGSNE